MKQLDTLVRTFIAISWGCSVTVVMDAFITFKDTQKSRFYSFDTWAYRHKFIDVYYHKKGYLSTTNSLLARWSGFNNYTTAESWLDLALSYPKNELSLPEKNESVQSFQAKIDVGKAKLYELFD